jgi:hypothetical protein
MVCYGMYIYIYIYISVSICMYMYVYVCICIIYIYIFDKQRQVIDGTVVNPEIYEINIVELLRCPFPNNMGIEGIALPWSMLFCR